MQLEKEFIKEMHPEAKKVCIGGILTNTHVREVISYLIYPQCDGLT